MIRTEKQKNRGPFDVKKKINKSDRSAALTEGRRQADGSVIGAVISVEVKAQWKNRACGSESKRVRATITAADLIPKKQSGGDGFASEREPLIERGPSSDIIQ